MYVPEFGLKIKYMTNELEYEWLLIEQELSSNFDILDSYSIINQTRVWNSQLEEELNNSQEEIDNLKAQLYKCFFNISQANKIRSNITDGKRKLLRLQRDRAVLDQYSIDGVIEYSRLAFFIEKSTYKDGQLYDWSDCSLVTIMDYWRNNYISERAIREIARSEEWLSIYNTAKNLQIPVFDVPVGQLNSDQKRLLTWSGIYHSIHQIPDGPDEEIIKDDDALDGFLIAKKAEVVSKNRRNAFERSLTESQRNAEELYIVPDPDDWQNSLKRIRESNNRVAQMKIDARKDAIRKLKQGETIKHGNLPDVRQRLILEANKAERLRGKHGI